MALEEADVDEAFIADALCVVATGTHLSHPRTEAAVLKALRLARAKGLRTALDIDYRPNLWGLAGHDAGEERYIASGAVTAKLMGTLHLFDLIAGTEEEFAIAGGSRDMGEALRAVRAVSEATLVLKRGPMGAVAFPGAIPDDLAEGLSGPGFPIEIYNVLGAGDGFMAGLLKGWLDGEAWERTLAYANACGAFAVSRHGCAPSYPTWAELDVFLKRGVVTPALRKDPELAHIHWATTRRGDWPALRVFAFDHRAQLEEIAAEVGAGAERIGRFKALCLDATRHVADGRAGYGILCDPRLGADALMAAAGSGLWIGRPVEKPGSRPLELEIGRDYGSALAEWPLEHVVKVLCFYHPDDAPETKAAQEEVVLRLAEAARANGLELLLEIVASKAGPLDDDTTARAMARFYDLGVKPDWWKLEPLRSDAAWARACAVIEDRDPWCRGIVVLGLGEGEDGLRESFVLAARHARVKGFAVGRTIFGEAARGWLAGEIEDEAATADMAGRFARLCAIWDEARETMR